MNEKKAVLYVDDEPINLVVFKMNLDRKYSIITAESGFEGLEKLAKNPAIRIVVSDMKMPGMNGVEFIRKAKIEFPTVDFFILTGFEITKEISDAIDEQIISKYFRKPFDIHEIENSINEALSKN